VARLDARTRRRPAVERRDHHVGAFRRAADFHADSLVAAERLDARLLALRGIEKHRVAVESRRHSADRVVDERFVVDRFGVLRANGLKRFDETARILPGEYFLFGRSGMCRTGKGEGYEKDSQDVRRRTWD